MKKPQKKISIENISLLKRTNETISMKDLKDFLLMCAGTNSTTLKKSPSDINKQIGIGGTVLFTAIFAAAAASYAMYFVFLNVWLAAIVGIVWGLLIFNLDRYIVSTMKHRGGFLRRLLMASPRIAIAVIIAIVIASPMEMKIFEREIESKLVEMQQEQELDQNEAIELKYDSQFRELDSMKVALESRITASELNRDQLAQRAVEEADGTGGSQRRNMGPIYKIKKAEADKAALEHELLVAELGEEIDILKDQIEENRSQLQEEIATTERPAFNGIAARLMALDRIKENNPIVATAHGFIFLLFLLIECCPILVKLISERGTYDLNLHVHEQQVELYHKEVTSLRSQKLEEHLRYESEVGQAKLNAKIQIERAKIKRDIEDRLGSLGNETA